MEDQVMATVLQDLVIAIVKICVIIIGVVHIIITIIIHNLCDNWTNLIRGVLYHLHKHLFCHGLDKHHLHQESRVILSSITNPFMIFSNSLQVKINFWGKNHKQLLSWPVDDATNGTNVETGLVSCIKAHYDGWQGLVVSRLVKWFQGFQAHGNKWKFGRFDV